VSEIEFDGPLVIERAELNESEEGRALAGEFVALFGAFVSDRVRPVLREIAERGEEPQLIVNGLAQLLRQVADSIEWPVGMER